MSNIWKEWQTTAVAIAGLIVWLLPTLFPSLQIPQDLADNIAKVVFFVGLLLAGNISREGK